MAPLPQERPGAPFAPPAPRPSERPDAARRPEPPVGRRPRPGPPARGGALFLAAQGLGLGPLLVVQALTGYFGGTLRVGPRLLTAVGLVPVAIHLALAWLLTGRLGWSVAGAGLARLGAALAAAAA